MAERVERPARPPRRTRTRLARARRGAIALLATLAGAPASGAAEPAMLLVWRLERGATRAPDRAPMGRLRVGSLQKPFVARAWAEAHVGAQAPRLRCAGGTACWAPAGHGESDLARALSLSCNSYFLQLAQDTPANTLERVLRAEGFDLAGPPSPRAAIGLPDGTSPVIAPETLLQAYARLVARPWPAGENVRALVLQGLREAARSGTAKGLGRRGLWAKTGTVPALDGAPLATSGWVLALDDAGSGRLGLLTHGTGREAARRMGAAWRAEESGADEAVAAANVRVLLLSLLRPERASARNVGTSPVRLVRPGDAGAWLGPQATLALAPGTRLGFGQLELRAPQFGFVRRVSAALQVDGHAGGALELVADVPLRDYVSGVVAAEAPRADPPLREELAAVLLRFLADGPRHAPKADVCDATHCAVFGGRGPRLIWIDPRRARVDPYGPAYAPLDQDAWQRARDAAARQGPRHFSGHCGGRPLSERYVWGAGDAQPTVCARHASGASAAWRRVWPRAALRRAFGTLPQDLRVDDADGVWHLVLTGPTVRSRLLFDDAHRRLAQVLGWDALPSPATRVRAVPAGFEAEGVGAGHRVGLCLAP